MPKKIVKRTGGVVEFDPGIFKRSLMRAGATRELAEKLAVEIERSIKDGDSTNAIYKNAFTSLHEREKKVAMQYSLKRALFGLGPTGFPFEKFVAEIFRRKGYDTKTNLHLRGGCISHEVDVFAENNRERVAMEVKFHNNMTIRSDVKALLYIKARFDDLLGKTGKPGKGFFKSPPVDRCVLVTNTKFTKKAIEYAECAGVDLLGWNYPFAAGLPEYIKEVDAHPVTSLPSLSQGTVQSLFNEGIVTCRTLVEEKKILHALPNSSEVEKEIGILCTPEGRKH